MPHVHFINVVWGERYTGLLLEIILPTQLSAGNLPGFRDAGGTGTYRIFTTTQDGERIRRSAVYAALTAVLPVEFVLIDDLLGNAKYSAMAESHRRAIRTANASGAALVFLSPDAIFSDGSFRGIQQLLDRGKRVVALSGLRVLKEAILPRLEARKDLTLGPRELVKEVLEHPHPYLQSCYWDAPHFTRWPSNLYWRVGDEGCVARSFHFHPLLVHPTRKELDPVSTIDDDYLSLACPDPADWHVVEDSDEMVAADLTGESELGDLATLRPARESDVAFWALYQANPHHRALSRNTLRFHCGERSAAWAPVEAAADRTMQAIESHLRHPFRSFPLRRAVRSAGLCLKAPLKALLGRPRIERIRRRLGI